MVITSYKWQEIEGVYPGIFSEFFPDETLNPADAPAMVYVGQQEDIIGFLAGYFHNLETLYIQRIGLRQDLRGKQLTMGFFVEAVEYLRRQGIRYLIGAIENTNRAALIAALKAGFLVNGCRVDTRGKLFVEMIIKINE